MSWKNTNKHRQILANAEKGRYGVIAVIAYNIEHILGFVSAAEKARSPLIIQFFPWAITTTDGLLIRAAADAVSRATVPISIHLDHAQSEDIIKQAAELPFDSIMVDMSHYEKEENLRKTRELVKYCNDRQKATEAEPGRIDGAEDGVMDTGELESIMTTPEEVEEFVDTGVCVLAPAIGNIHGHYPPSGPQLDFERLERVRNQASGRVNIALHGTNDFEPELLKQCIVAGATKINVNRLVLDDYYEHLHANVGKIPHTQLIDEGIKKVEDLTVKWMEICGSAGKA